MSKLSRVLVLNHFAAPLGQPGGTRHVELFSRLPGWEYLILASNRNLHTGEPIPNEPGFITVKTVRYSSNGFRRILNWLSYAIMATLTSFRLRKIDIIYASSPHLLTGLAGYLIAKLRRKPFILEVRDLWPRILVDMKKMKATHPIYRILENIDVFLYKHSDHIVFMAPGTQDALRLRGVPASKMTYIPNGADPQNFKPTQDRDSLRSEYGFTTTTAVYAGAHGPANGLDLLLDAAKRIEDISLSIVLIGDGVDKIELIRRVNIEQTRNITFLDPVPKSEMANLLHAADIGLHVLADIELFQTAVSPNKLFDYMAAGLPVITNTGGVVGSWVKESRSGYVCKPEAIDEALRKICALSEDERKAMGLNGQEWIEKDHSRSSCANTLLAVLNSEAHI